MRSHGLRHLIARPVSPVGVAASALVVVGGALGTAIRQLLEEASPAVPGAFPSTTFGVNLAGAFVLGLLMETLSRQGPEVGLLHRVRLLLGTGFCGGFTTYSTLAVEVFERLGRQGVAPVGAGYLLASVVAGTLTAAAGVLLGTLLSADRRTA